MKIKLLISRATAKEVYKAGDEIEVSEREAQRLVAAGKAVVVETVPKRETTRKKPIAETREV